MDPLEPLLTPDERDSLRPQRPPERFAERVLADVAALRVRRVRQKRALAAAAVAFALVAAAAVAMTVDRVPRRGEIRADAREDVHLGPHVIAVLERGAHVAWNGDEVTQFAGNVFYRFEPGGLRRVHTPAGDVLVRGTCFDVKVRAEEGADMTRRDAVAGVVGAMASAAVLVGVYEGKVTLSRANGSVDVTSGQGARADAGGIHGPQELGAAEHDFEGPSKDESWRTANASLADEVKLYQRRLEDSQEQTKRITKDLDQLKAKLTALEPDAAAASDPFNPTKDQWKELAKANIVRAKNFCFPPADWRPGVETLADLGLAPADASALQQALAAASQRMWQAIGPACAQIVGSVEVAQRLGNETCGTILQRSLSQADFAAATQLVANVRAGNTPMPPPNQINGVEARLLAMTTAASDLEKDLSQSFGPEEAHRLALGDTPWSCALQFEPGLLGQLGSGSQ